MHIGFLGLGHLGKAIAGRLLDCGHSLTVWNRTPSKADGLNAERASTPSEVAAKAGIVFLCMFDSNAVRSVLTRENGLLSGQVSGKTIIDLTSNHFRDVLDFHDLCKEAGATYMETPVLGSIVPASQGALTVLVSGEKEGYERIRPLLEDIGKQIFYLAEPSLATKMKLINNLALGSFMATIAEALSLGEQVGIEKRMFWIFFQLAGAILWCLMQKRKNCLKRIFPRIFQMP